LNQETDLEADEPETVKVADDVAEAGIPQPIRV
jgi:aerobic C4-dicarboxylate transport protein